MKYFLVLKLTFLVFVTSNIYSQSGWYNTFYHDYAAITCMAERDSMNFFCFSVNSYINNTYLWSTDGGNTWLSYKLSDSICQIRGCAFINPVTGWAVGYSTATGPAFGVMYKTTDGGINWIKQQCDTSIRSCWTIKFINQNTGFIGGIAGMDGKLLKTTNSGLNWNIKTFPGTRYIRNIYFINYNTGWITGDYGCIYKTTDCGNNWVNLASNSPLSSKLIQDFCYIDSSNYTVLATGSNPDTNGYIYRTTNSGLNWYPQYVYTKGYNKYLYGIKYLNFMNGFTWGGNNMFMKTSNSGNNWINLNHIANFEIFSVYFKNNDIFYAAGGNFLEYGYCYENYIIKTTNAGSNWSIINHNWDYSMLHISFANSSTGFVISDSGRIFKTTDGGTNWNMCYKNNSASFQSIELENNLTGYAVGGIANTNIHVLRTTNTGSTWQEILVPAYYDIIDVKSLGSGVVAAINITDCFRSTNSGLSWDSCILPQNPNKLNITNLSFIDNNTGYILGNELHYISSYNWWYVTDILKTTNKGINWSYIVSTPMGHNKYTMFQMLGNGVGYLLKDYGGYLKTTNEGVSWDSTMPFTSTYLSCINMLNSSTGWICGLINNNNYGTIYKTTNGGITWLKQFESYKKTPRSMYVFNNTNAWFCGDNSSVFKTTNGGGVIGIETINNKIPFTFALSQNYPNPFNPTTKINYDLPMDCKVTMIIYDILGREVIRLVNNEFKKAGRYIASFDGHNLSSGVYFYRIEAHEVSGSSTGEFIQSKKMVLVK